MNQEIRNRLRTVVTQCRTLLEKDIRFSLEGTFSIYEKNGAVIADPQAPMVHLVDDEERKARIELLEHFHHIKARGFKAKDALDQLVREIAFTHLNRLCAYKMMEAREVYINGQKFREAVSRGIDSNGLKFYLADHPEEERLYNTGHQDIAYRRFLDWLGGLLSDEIGVLFDPNDPANRLYPRQKTLDEVLDLLNSGNIKPEEKELREEWPKIWTQDETIGWVYQYFTPKELRDQARKESQAPRNSYELAFRNQFFTPRYVVEFLTDNTLGRIWYEMQNANTKLVEKCDYLVHRSHSVFLSPGEEGPKPFVFGEWDKAMQTKEAWTCPPSDNNDLQAIWQYALTLDGYEFSKAQYGRECGDLANECLEEYRQTKKWRGSFQELRCCLFFEQRRWRHFGYDPEGEDLTAILELFGAVCERWNFETEFIPHRPKKDPRELRILDPACGSGHFLLYCFDLLLTIYEEAYADPDLAPALHEKYPTLEALQRDVPRLILAHNVHGIDIDLRCSQIAALALWLRCQRVYQEMGLKKERPKITRSNFVCAEPMPGEAQLLKEFVSQLEPKLLGHVVEVVFDKMKLAGEAGSLLKIDDDIRDAVSSAKKQWVREMSLATDRKGQPLLFTQAEIDRIHQRPEQTSLFDVSDITNEQFFERAEGEVIKALRQYAEQAHNGHSLQRQLFMEDAVRGFAFVNLCQKQYDVVLMNPPFGEASLPSQSYIQATYADTKGDVYKSFVECFQDRLVPAGLLGIISSRSGFFLGQSADWRERIVLRLFRPVLLADFGSGVLDAMVETAAYVLRTLDEDEDRQLTLRLLGDVKRTETDKAGYFSIPRYQHQRGGLKRHQANGELRRLLDAGFICEIPGNYRRFQALREAIEQAPQPRLESSSELICVRLSTEKVKQDRLLASVVALRTGSVADNSFLTDLSALVQIPGSPFAYWINERVRRLFVEMAPFKSGGRHACVTNPAGNDQRYFRCWWEVPSQNIGRHIRWSPMCKGGEFRRYYADLHLVVDWDENEGTFRGFQGTVHRPLKRPASADYFFQPGLTYSSRTQLAFSSRILPEGTIFHDKGPGVFVPVEDRYPILGLMNSKVFQALLKLQMAFGSYEVGVIQRTPIPNLGGPESDQLGKATFAAVNAVRVRDQRIETSHQFCLPALLDASGTTLSMRSSKIEEWFRESTTSQTKLQSQIDALAFQLYGFNAADQATIEESAGIKIDEGNDDDSDFNDSNGDSEDFGVAVRELVADLLAYSVGCVAGRWDVRFATGARFKSDLADPFAPLPVCSPGTLTGANGLPVAVAPGGYPLHINVDGVLPDDPDHPEDIVYRVREVLELIWKDRAESIEKESSDAIGVKELRDYFRKPSKGGFWDDHVSRYSKSRRKAPIYWQLQSSKRNYALWLYYHRLDKDMLFKALVNYVEPKIRLEISRLETLRSQKATAGESGKEAKRLSKEVERQEDFISELHDFEDKLRRAATLHLEPDLNDGVVLNIAPLYELVPWKEAKNYWDELLEGKYEWSSIGKQLRQKGLVK
jgi:hypothetical protein